MTVTGYGSGELPPEVLTQYREQAPGLVQGSIAVPVMRGGVQVAERFLHPRARPNWWQALNLRPRARRDIMDDPPGRDGWTLESFMNVAGKEEARIIEISAAGMLARTVR